MFVLISNWQPFVFVEAVRVGREMPGTSDTEEDAGRLAVETPNNGRSSWSAGQISAAAVHNRLSTVAVT